VETKGTVWATGRLEDTRADFSTPHPLSSEANFYRAFIAELDQQSRAVAVWNGGWSRPAWTEVAVAALATVVREMNLRVAAKGHPDEFGQSEYLGLDIVGYRGDFSAPRVVVEHENTGWKVPYCAWKVACVDAKLRVVVAYWDPRARTARPRSFEALQQEVRLPMHSQPGKRLLLIGGGYGPQARQGGWGEIFQHVVCVS